jgi:EpsI family protein
LMTLGFLMAYFYKGALWKRIILFLSSVPITILMNSWRIGTIGVMVEHWGIGMAERRRALPGTFIAAGGVLVTFVVIALVLPRPAEIIPKHAGFVDFPMRFGEWLGESKSMEGIYIDELKLDDYLLADYTDGHGPAVNFYIAYYNSQRKGEAVHSPRACLPGGGWQLRDFDQRTLANVKIDGKTVRVNRTLIELDNQRELVYYWFQQRGRIITNEFAVKWYLFWDALTRHRTDGALVRLVVSVPPTSSEEAADRRLVDLVGRVAPVLTHYVPD